MEETTGDFRTNIVDTMPKSSAVQYIKKLPATPNYINKDPNKLYCKTIKEYKVFGPGETDFMCCRFDSHDEFVATGGSNGFIYIYSIETSKHETLLASEYTSFPITCMRWIPSDIITLKSILISGSCDGTISHYDARKGKQLAQFKEQDNQILCLDMRPDGTKFAAAGKDQTVRIYDEVKQMLDVEFPPGMWSNIGHSNRIFSLKFHPDEPNFLVSGGWDNTLLFWDLREARSVGSIYGPSICGDTIDIFGKQILTGSYRSHNQLELWEFSSRKKLRDIFWNNETNPQNALIYGCEFSKTNGKTIVAGCSGLDEVRCFDVDNNYKYFGKTGDFKHNIFSVDFANNSDLFAYCGTDGHVHTVEINSKNPEKFEI